MGVGLLEVWSVDELGILQLWETISNFMGLDAGWQKSCIISP